jgi:hypothetical protein
MTTAISVPSQFTDYCHFTSSMGFYKEPETLILVKKCIVIPFETIFVAFSCIVLIKFKMQSPGSKNTIIN